jgi:hypothetical protein
MRRHRKTCLVNLLLASSSFQFDRFIAAQSPQATQHRQEQSAANLLAYAPGAAGSPAEKTNRWGVIGVTNDAQFSASRHVHTFGGKFQVLGAGRGR